MDIIGKSPVPVPFLIIGKLALLVCFLFFLVKAAYPDTVLYDSSATRILGIIFFASGLLFVIVSLVQLGQSAAVGFPERETDLRTTGLYRYSRNPVYVGAFMMCLGSCLYSIHLINFIACAIGVAVHMRIVQKEEEFLEKRFGTLWLDYRRRVPRYLGIIR